MGFFLVFLGMVAYGYSEVYGAKGFSEPTRIYRIVACDATRRVVVVVVKLCRKRTNVFFSLFSLLRVSIDLFGR